MEILNDGQNQTLYQWDRGQRLILEGAEAVTRVDFAWYGAPVAQSCPVYREDDSLYADIPDAMLQQNGKLLIYLVSEAKDGEETVQRNQLYVMSKPKPTNYVEPEQAETWSALEQRIGQLEQAAGGQKITAEIVDGVLVCRMEENA